MFDGFVIMSGGHCTHPTGGPAIHLKHKKNLPNAGGTPLKVRLFHCTSIGLTLAITPNVGNSSV